MILIKASEHLPVGNIKVFQVYIGDNDTGYYYVPVYSEHVCSVVIRLDYPGRYYWAVIRNDSHDLD